MASAATKQAGASEDEQKKAYEEGRNEDDGASAVNLYFCHEVARVGVDQRDHDPSGICLHVASH